MKSPRLALVLALLSALPTGLQAQQLGGTDVRIGAADNRTGARFSRFDFDPGSGHYFAVVAWNDRWTFNISTDGGASFDRRYRLLSSAGIAALDMAVSGDWVYVGYTTNLTSDEARLRRFSVDTGDLDLNYEGPNDSTVLVADTAPEDVIDIALASNIDSTDDRLYYSLLQTDGSTRFFWNEPGAGTDFFELTVGLDNAVGGLDLHWNPGASNHILLLSAIDDQGEVEVWRLGGSWSRSASFAYDGSDDRSAISAFGDQIVVAYLAAATHGQAVVFRQSTDGGDTWGAATTIAEPTEGQGDFFDVDITARGGIGLAVVYSLEAGAVDQAFFQSKPSYGSGPWRPAGPFNDFDPVTGLEMALDWTPSDLYGVIYIGGDDFIPYFDQVESILIFVDGFESGDTSSWGDTTSPQQRR